jgi:hypothetical protein
MKVRYPNLKDGIIYNDADNLLMVGSYGDNIYIICNKEGQMQEVIDRMTTNICKLSGYEEWDEDEDKKWILTFHTYDSDNIETQLSDLIN